MYIHEDVNDVKSFKLHLIKRDKKKKKKFFCQSPHPVMSDAESRHDLPLSRKEIQACLP